MRTSTKIVIAILFSVVLGVGAANRLRAENDEGLYARLDLFGDALAIVQNHYVRDIDVQELIYGAIEGMVGTLDAHSSFLPPRAFKEMQVETSGEFGGIGIEITLREDWLTVVSPIEDTPASKAGLESGDRIIAIEGKSTQGQGLMDAVEKLRGQVGTSVTITVIRPLNEPDEIENTDWSEAFDVTLVRDKIRVQSVRHELKEDGKILYVKLTQFQARTGSELRKLLAKEIDGDKIGLVLDLRNNPGGLLDQAIEVADIFLQDGKIVYTEGRDPKMHNEWFAEDDGDEPTLPVVVLVNGGTASASEIVAGAIQDHRAGVLVGSRSFGKGSVQTILRLRDGSGVRVTTALYYTPSGRSIQAAGIAPDIKVSNPDLESLVRREEDLERHLELTENGAELGNGDEEDLPVSEKIERRREALEKLRERKGDPVLDRAIDILKGVEVFGSLKQAAAAAATSTAEAAQQ